MAAMTEYPGARAFLFHTERKEGGRLYGDVLMMGLDTLRQDIERPTIKNQGGKREKTEWSSEKICTTTRHDQRPCQRI